MTLLLILRHMVLSPSVWREWIEILLDSILCVVVLCLPPCGGSGLKYNSVYLYYLVSLVSLRVEGVD